MLTSLLAASLPLMADGRVQILPAGEFAPVMADPGRESSGELAPVQAR